MECTHLIMLTKLFFSNSNKFQLDINQSRSLKFCMHYSIPGSSKNMGFTSLDICVGSLLAAWMMTIQPHVVLRDSNTAPNTGFRQLV